jgi:hypothetical protein
MLPHALFVSEENTFLGTTFLSSVDELKES